MAEVTCIRHDWEARPLHSDDDTQRYQCLACGRWGYRLFADGKVSPILPYADGRTDPDPSWELQVGVGDDFLTCPEIPPGDDE